MVWLASGRGVPCRKDLTAHCELLSEAVRLARSGRYDDAMAVLARLPGDGALRPSMLDLKAKIHAQQGRYLEAEACWREALSLVPNHQGFRRALAAIAEERRYPFWLRIVVAAAVAAVTSGALLVVAVGILRWAGWLGR